jgi:DNA polymerase III subunit epsilon
MPFEPFNAEPASRNDQNAGLEYIAFDLETTGLLAETDRVVEIGAVRFTNLGRECERFQQLINPERPMSPSAQAIHGLSDADLAGAPPARDVLPRFLSFLGDSKNSALIAHNAAFDAGFLGRELTRAHMPLPHHRAFDTLALARRRHPQLPSHRLDALAHFLGLDLNGLHRAIADSLLVKELWLRFGGPRVSPMMLVSYPIHDPGDATPPPHGWEPLNQAITFDWTVRIEYEGGTRGISPREITPRRFVQRGGLTYLVAYCHLDRFEKSFRLDRIRQCEIVTA